jgi:hypothetical protein
LHEHALQGDHDDSGENGLRIIEMVLFLYDIHQIGNLASNILIRSPMKKSYS